MARLMYRTMIVNAQTGEFMNRQTERRKTAGLPWKSSHGRIYNEKIFAALCALLLVPTMASANSDLVSIAELHRQTVERDGGQRLTTRRAAS